MLKSTVLPLHTTCTTGQFLSLLSHISLDLHPGNHYSSNPRIPGIPSSSQQFIQAHNRPWGLMAFWEQRCRGEMECLGLSSSDAFIHLICSINPCLVSCMGRPESFINQWWLLRNVSQTCFCEQIPKYHEDMHINLDNKRWRTNLTNWFPVETPDVLWLSCLVHLQPHSSAQFLTPQQPCSWAIRAWTKGLPVPSSCESHHAAMSFLSCSWN